MDDLSIFRQWAEGLTQANVDLLLRLDMAFPGFTREALRRLRVRGYVDDHGALIARAAP